MKPSDFTSSETRLFLDAEWADNSGKELISIALVDERGARRFYAELDPLPSCPTDFAKFAVYPLLERGWSAMQRVDLARDLRHFLGVLNRPVLIHDHPNDWLLFCSALGEGHAIGKIRHTLLCRRDVASFIQAYFDQHPGAAGFRHHARIDADALRWAYIRMREKGLIE